MTNPKFYFVIMRKDDEPRDKISSIYKTREKANEYRNEIEHKYDETVVTSRFLEE